VQGTKSPVPLYANLKANLASQQARRKWVLLALSLAEGQPLSPVQLQKTIFLFGELLPKGAVPNDFYEFVPDNYGPFCGEVYDDARWLAREGLASVGKFPGADYQQYAATERGIVEGRKFSRTLPNPVREYSKKLAAWVREQSFKSLVSAIYQQFPKYKVNSVFWH
jgi:hypothetical protein